jgi:uncharacterized protein
MKKMINILIVFAILLFSIVFSAAVALSASPTVIKIGTHPMGSFQNMVGMAVGQVIEKNTSLKAKVIPLSGPNAWMPMLLTKEIDLGLTAAPDAYSAFLGEKDYKEISRGKGFPFYLVLTGTFLDVSIVAAKDSGIRTLKDLRGKRVALAVQVESAKQITEAGLANAGLTMNDVSMIPVSSVPAGMKEVINGRADACAGPVGQPQVAELAAKKGALLLPFDTSSEAKARTLNVLPWSSFFLQKAADKFPGIDMDTWLMRIEIYLGARADLPNDLVYTIIKTMWDNHSDLVPIHPKFKDWQRENYASKVLAVPAHPGAVKFLKEKGLWTSELEKKNKELLLMKK